MLIAGGNLIKKVLFPAEVLPVVTVLANLVHFLLGLPDPAGLPRSATAASRPSALLLPLPVLVQLVFTLGLALVVSALTVHFRDIQNILGHLAAPAGSSPRPSSTSTASSQGALRTFLRLNPMSHILVSYQQMLFDGHFDHWRGPRPTAASSPLVVFAVGAFLFDRLRDTLAEEV